MQIWFLVTVKNFGVNCHIGWGCQKVEMWDSNKLMCSGLQSGPKDTYERTRAPALAVTASRHFDKSIQIPLWQNFLSRFGVLTESERTWTVCRKK